MLCSVVRARSVNWAYMSRVRSSLRYRLQNDGRKRSPRMICCRMSALALAAIVAVCCQNSPPANAPIPDWVLYSGLFKRVCWEENFGDHLDAAGKNSSFVRSKIQKAVGLTVEEDAALKRIAKDWDAANRAY